MSRFAVGAVVVGVLLRLALIGALAGRPLSDDASDYHHMATQLSDGGSFEPDWPPGLPYYLRTTQAVLGRSITADRVAMLLLYVIFSALVFGLARRVSGERAGNLAVAIFALFPSFIYLSITPLTQLPTALLLVGATWAALEFYSAPDGARGWGRAALLGLALAGLLVTRPSNVLLCLVAPLALVLVTRRVSALVAPALVMALLVGAWTMRAHELTGRWLFINNANSQNMFYGNNPWTPLYRTWWFGSHKKGEPGVPDEFVATHARLAAHPPAERDRAFSQFAVAHIKARPDLFVIRSLARVRTFFAFDTFTGAQIAAKAKSRVWKLVGLAVIAADAACYLVVAGLALFWFFVPGDRRVAYLLGFAVLLYAAPYFASFAHPTYHFPVVPLLAVAAAAMWCNPRPKLEGRRRTWFLVAAAAFMLIQLEWIMNMFSRV